jgi:phage FluMu protein Com
MKCPICENTEDFNTRTYPTGYYRKIRTTGVVMDMDEFVKTGEKQEIKCNKCNFVMEFIPSYLDNQL